MTRGSAGADAAARAAADVVLACARVGVPDDVVAALFARAEREQVVAAALHHRLGPLVHVRLRDAVGVELADLAYEQRGQLLTHLRAVAELRRTGETLDALGVRWVAVKGPVLAAVYARPDLRSYGDLDLLVDRRRLGDVLDALVDSGAQMIDVNWTMIERETRGELSVRLPGGTPLDLHWALVNDRGLRRTFPFPTDEMLDRRTTMLIEGVRVPVLAAGDAVVHLAYHGLHSGGHRLVWTADIDRVVRASAPDWDLVGRTASAARAQVVVAVALERAVRLLGTPVPRDVLRSLAAPLGWRAVVRLADRVRPPELSFRPGATGRLVVESARGTTPQSARAALAHARRLAAARRGAARESATDETAGAPNAAAAPAGQADELGNPLYVDTGDGEARRRYLDRLAGPDGAL